MTQASSGKQRSAFSWWLRTGNLSPGQYGDRIELKFNPWHDPEDGRFTFAGTGRYFGRGEAVSADGTGKGASRTVDRGRPSKPRIGTIPRADAPRTEQPTRYSKRPGSRGAIEAQPKSAASRGGDQPNPALEFMGGIGEGFYDVAEGAVAGAYSTLTTNPVTTVRNAGRGIAGMIDTAIAAEDTPALVQASGAADAVANASARDIGRATGSVAGNAALAVAPGAAVTKVSALRRLRMARPRATYDPPQIGWVKENLGRDSPAKRYNDSATGARPNQAPTLVRTMPDGSKRPVKFDGVEGDFVIDRKFSVVDRPHARAQLQRQSDVLAQHRLVGTWEVPTPRRRPKPSSCSRR